MKTHPLTFGLLTASLLTFRPIADAAEQPTLQEAYKDFFRVGVAINRSVAADSPPHAFRSRELIQKDKALVLKQFNQIVPENDLKWASIHPREGADGYNFGPADAFVNFGLSNHLYLVGHTLVWHGQTPNWVFQSKNPPPAAPTPSATPAPAAAGMNPPGAARTRGGGRDIGPRASREELLARMREHIYTIVGRYKGKIKVWDVVNEAVSDHGPEVLRDSLWREIIGPDFIAKAFEYAHEADPEAILRYNDYGLENPVKRRKFVALIKSLQEQKAPISAIGTQTHVSVSAPSFEEMDQTLTDLTGLGLPIHITELDVNGARSGQRTTEANTADNALTTQGGLIEDADQRLAGQYANLFKASVKHKDAVKMVTFWGVNDAVSWRADGKPLLFDGNDAPKQAFDAVIKAASGNP